MMYTCVFSHSQRRNVWPSSQTKSTTRSQITKYNRAPLKRLFETTWPTNGNEYLYTASRWCIVGVMTDV
eukprot:7378788-Prymnesium_polylepis.2